jgi:hypothetical protein
MTNTLAYFADEEKKSFTSLTPGFLPELALKPLPSD